jgi:enterochelin esterase-like enzyme
VCFTTPITSVVPSSVRKAVVNFAALRRPDLFGNVLSQSGAFWCCNGRDNLKWEWLSTAYQTSPKLRLRFFIEAGLLEDISKDGPTLLAANRRFVEVLERKGYPTTYEEVGGSHEPVHWRSTLAEALMSLAN